MHRGVELHPRWGVSALRRQFGIRLLQGRQGEFAKLIQVLWNAREKVSAPFLMPLFNQRNCSALMRIALGTVLHQQSCIGQIVQLTEFFLDDAELM